MPASSTRPSQDRQRLAIPELRILFLSSVGGALEFYDFVVFVFFAVVIGRLFFPPDLPDWVRQLQTFGIFAAGYLARPLGGVFMAHFGDTRGRKRVFTFSILLMANATFIIGLLPTYKSIGTAAPVLLLLLRIVQGMAIGGQVPGGWVFVAEHAGPGRVGFALGLLTSGLTGGILLGSLVAAALNLTFSQAQILAGWWRLPFLMGGVFGFLAMMLRRWLEETPVFEEIRRRAATSRQMPLRVVLKDHVPASIAGMITTWMLTAAIVVLILMSPALLQKSFGLPASQTQVANLAGAVALVLGTVMTGALTDRFGLRGVAAVMLPVLCAGAYALYLTAERAPSLLLPAYAFAGLGAGAVALTPVALVRSFPPAVRFSGISFSYNIAYALFGGVTPLFVSWIAHLNRISPAHYVAAVCVLGFIATVCTPLADEAAIPSAGPSSDR